jgi:hypothetical protein
MYINIEQDEENDEEKIKIEIIGSGAKDIGEKFRTIEREFSDYTIKIILDENDKFITIREITESKDKDKHKNIIRKDISYDYNIMNTKIDE